jgi:hypothetical protein
VVPVIMACKYDAPPSRRRVLVSLSEEEAPPPREGTWF